MDFVLLGSLSETLAPVGYRPSALPVHLSVDHTIQTGGWAAYVPETGFFEILRGVCPSRSRAS